MIELEDYFKRSCNLMCEYRYPVECTGSMATYHEVFTYSAPVEVVRQWLQEKLSKYFWNVMKQEPQRFLIQEKMPSGQIYHPGIYIGAAQIEIILKQVSSGTEVVFDSTNEYYGEDPRPQSDLNLSNGHVQARSFLEIKVGVIKLGLDNKFKDWSAQQRFQSIQEQKRLPQQATPTINASAPVQTGVLNTEPVKINREFLSVEDFVSKLERLATLHSSGALTTSEFERAKLCLLEATE